MPPIIAAELDAALNWRIPPSSRHADAAPQWHGHLLMERLAIAGNSGAEDELEAQTLAKII